jgi:UDP-3-O-[3-hydroxymyristoyl] N-acetylglucosamine deacetylase
MGHVVLHRAGHDLMNRLVRKILESPERYRHIELGADLPNMYVESQSHWLND